MTNLIVYAIVALILLLLLLLMFLISNIGKNSAPAKKKNYRSANDSLQFISIHGLDLPKDIERLAKSQIPSIVSQILRTYEKLDYKKNIHEFTKPQWHTWQVSMLFKMYKVGLDVYIGNPQAIFPEELLSKSDRDLRQIMNDLIVKYRRDVETHRNRDFLSRDIIWTGRDVAHIYLFLSRYQSFDKDLR